jgi:hypothetical protein
MAGARGRFRGRPGRGAPPGRTGAAMGPGGGAPEPAGNSAIRGGGGPPPAKDDRGDRGGASPLRRTAVVRAGHSVFTEPIGSVLRYAGKFGSSEIGTDRFLQKLGTEGVRYR